MKLRKFSKQILSIVLAVFMVVGLFYGVDFLPELKADAATVNDAITDLHHDQASYFMSNIQPAAGESVTIRMRAVKGNVSSAKLYYYNLDTGKSTEVSMSMSSKVYDNTGYYEYWEATFTVPDASGVRYWFSATNKSNKIGSMYLNKTYYLVQYADNLFSRVKSSGNYSEGWLISPKVQTPDWAKGSTWYSFVPDEFFNGDPSNDDYAHSPNQDVPWNTGLYSNLNNRYGGDFQGVMDKIAYIKSLGVNGICFNPVNAANQSVGYGSSNFNQIESTFGNGQTYKQFINFMHDNDLRIIQDIAVYHTANDSVIVNSSNRWPVVGANAGVDSPYYTVIVDHELSNNKITTPRWGGSIINHKDPTTQALLWSTKEGALVRYANDALGYGVDGYRFDCGGWITGHDSEGNVINTSTMMQEIRTAIKKVNPEAVVLSEAGGGMNGGGWDAEWNLSFLNYNTDIYEGKSSIQALRGLIMSQIKSTNRPVLLCSHLQLNTHDNQGKCFKGDNNTVLTALKLIQMTTIGSPSVYFGEETNYTNGTNYGFTYFDWDESNWNYTVMNFTKALLELRNEYSATRTGALIEYLYDTNHWYYGRFDENGAALTMVNNTSTATTYTLSAYTMGIGSGETLTDWFTGKSYTVDASGNVTVDVPVGGTIYVSGGKRSTYSAGFNATNITNDVSNNIGFTSAGADVTATYKANGTVSVAGNSEAVVKNAIIGKNFTISGDYTFTAAESSSAQANQIGISIGTTVIDGKTYRVGAVLRPYIASGAQFILCLTSGISDSDSRWIGVTAGPTITKGASNTVNFKAEVKDNILKVYVNDTYKAEMDISGYDIEIKPEFFSKCGGDAIAFDLSNVSLTGDVGTRNASVSAADGTVTVTRKGDIITSTNDNFKFYNIPAFGAFAYSTYVDSTNGSAAVMMRDSLANDSAYYAAVLNNGTLNVYVRNKAGATATVLTTKATSKATYVKVERDANNTFKTYLGTGTDASVNYVLVDGSAVSLGFNETGYVGYAVLDGTASIRSIGKVAVGDEVLADDFSGTVVKPLLNGVLDSNAVLGGGKLTLNPGDIFTANTPDNDWTFKTKFLLTSTTENDFAGIVNYQDADTYLFVGRKIIDGKVKLVFGKNSGDKILNFTIMDDPNPTAEITIQLQRMATMYTVVYTYDELKWYSLGGKIYYNMSDENPGIMVEGATNCAFDYISFGNAVNDGGSYNTPHTPDLDGFKVTEDKFTGSYNITSLTGTWTTFYNGAPVEEGFLQTESGVNAILATTNTKFEDFRAEATLKLENASWAGMNFGRKTPTQIGGGYFVKYTNEGKVVLEKDGVVLESYTLVDEVIDGGFLRVVVEVINGNLYICVGQNAKPVIEVLDFDYVSGYFAFCCDGVARFNNQNLNHMTATVHRPEATGSYSDAGIQINNSTYYHTVNITESGISTNYTETAYIKKFGDTSKDGAISEDEAAVARAKFYELLSESNLSYAKTRKFMSLRGAASTDFVISTNISILRSTTNKLVDTDMEGNEVYRDVPNYHPDVLQQVGLLLGSYVATTDLASDGIYVKYTSAGKLHLERNGKDLVTPYTVEGSPINIKLMVIKKNGTYNVYVNGSKTPVLTYTETVSNGGGFTFLANNATVVFDGIGVHDLDPSEDYTTTSTYQDWMSGANLANKGGYFADDFSDSSVVDDEWLVHHGNHWEVSDGILHTTDTITGAWDSSVCYAGGSYSDFILNFKIMATNPGGWGSIGFRRISPGVGHQANGTYLLFNTSGKISRMGYNVNADDLAYENSKTSIPTNYYTNRWQSFTLIVQGTSIRVYSDGKLVYHGQDTQYREGYIEFKGANGYWAFDDVEIIPLSTKSAPAIDTNIVDDLSISVNYSDYTSKYQSTKVINAGAYVPVTFSNFAAPQDKYSLSATLEKIASSEGYFETTVGVVKYQGAQYDLVIRINPFTSSTGINPEATVCLKSSDTTITLDSWKVDAFSSTKTSYDLDFAYESGKLSVWIDNETAFIDDFDLEALGIDMVLPQLSFYSTGCGIKISNLAVFGGASTVSLDPVTITDGFTFKGENNKDYTYDYMSKGALTLKSQKAFIENATVIYLSGISAEFNLDTDSIEKDDYNFGFILGTGKKSGTTSSIYAVVANDGKTAELYIGTTKLATASLPVEPEFGDNIFWDDDSSEPTDDVQGSNKQKDFELSVKVSTTYDVTFYVGEDEIYTANLTTLGVNNFKPTPGLVTDGITTDVSNVTLSGIGAYTMYDVENITDKVVLDNNIEYIENGNYTVSDNAINTLNNVVFGDDEFYFVGATFSSMPAGAKFGFTLGNTSNGTVKAYIKKASQSTVVYIYENATEVLAVSTSNADSYKFVVGYTKDGLISIWVNDKLVSNNTNLILDTHEYAIMAESANGTVVSGVAVWGDVSTKVAIDELDNGDIKIMSVDKENGLTVIAVNPAAGYQLVSGSLKYTDEKGVTRNVIGRYSDDKPNEFVVYDVGTNVKLTAKFTDMSVTNITTATIGSSLHTFEDTVSGINRIDGVRFLTRLYMPIEDINPQTGEITVNYNGKSYIVDDYGALMIPTTFMDKQGIAYQDLSFDNKEVLTAESLSAKQGAIYYASKDYLDFTIVITVPKTNKTGNDRDTYYNKYYAREYVIRSFVSLRASDGSQTIVYGDSFIDSINNVVERIESEV